MKVNRREAIGIALAGAGAAAAPLRAWATTDAPATVAAPRVCGLDSPLALGDLPPRFSWHLALPGNQARQLAYRVMVARNRADLAAGANLLWDSGRAASAQSVGIACGGPALPSRDRAHWQVQVWANGSKVPLSSTPATWETGLAPEDWQGEWLASETETARANRMAGLHWIAGTETLKAGQARQVPLELRQRRCGPCRTVPVSQ